MRVAANGDAKSPRQTKIGQLDAALGVDEQVLRLQITMQHAVHVTESDATQQLVQVALKEGQGEDQRGKQDGGEGEETSL